MPIRKLIFFAFILMTRPSNAFFEVKPWLDFPYEVHFRPSYELSRYHGLDRHTQGRNQSSWNHQLDLDLGIASANYVDLQVGSSFVETSQNAFTLMSINTMLRKQFLNDIEGDFLSFTGGLKLTFVPDHALKDFYVPYHNMFNFAVNAVIGKEFDKLQNWVSRAYLYSELGIANRGAPWLKSLLAVDVETSHYEGYLQANIDSYFGFGNQHYLVVDNFKGYYNTNHQSVDVNIGFFRENDIWGTWGISAGYRVFSKAFPAHHIQLKLSVDYPFSIF